MTGYSSPALPALYTGLTVAQGGQKERLFLFLRATRPQNRNGAFNDYDRQQIHGGYQIQNGVVPSGHKEQC